jgi:autonomous glycyl radical cofactor GrcA
MGSINPQKKQPKYNNNTNNYDICSEYHSHIDTIVDKSCGIFAQNSQVSDFQNSAKKTAIEYTCLTCDFITYKKYNYDQHVQTKKHIFNCENTVKHKKQFHCKDCDIFFSKNIDLIRHINTKKHLKNIGSININNVFTCKKCDKQFNKQSLLNRHLSSKLHLKQIDENEDFTKELHIKENKTTEEGEPDKYVDIVNKLLSENKELRSFFIEQFREQNDIITKLVDSNKSNQIITNTNNTINVNNNQKFNINVFLNEQCKDAVNLPEFIENIEITHTDLENNAQLGFVDGISKIFLDNIKQLSLYERPIHCTDLKRETLYIRCDDKWTKEDSTEKLNTAIRDVSYKSIGVLNNWKKNNPEYEDINSEFSDKCIVMSKNTLAGYERDVYYPKVIRIISKETMVDKNII